MEMETILVVMMAMKMEVVVHQNGDHKYMAFGGGDGRSLSSYVGYSSPLHRCRRM